MYGVAAYVRLCAEDRRDGAELDDGQDWADLPRCGGLRACAVGDLRTRRARSFGPACGVQLGRQLRLEDTASGIHQEWVRSADIAEGSIGGAETELRPARL